MSIELKVKYLQYIIHKNSERGFHILELLVVMFILGILAAMTLPNSLCVANKGKQAEGKQYVTSVNKGQKAYYSEFGKFVTSSDEAAWNSLGVGIRTQTTNYKYEIKDLSPNRVSVWATNLRSDIKSYSGTVGIIGSGSDKTTQAILCGTKRANVAPTNGEIIVNGITCAPNMELIK